MNFKRALPGRRFLKFIFSLALTWGILTLVYMFIPSFNPKDSTITDLLEFQGEKITRVYETGNFFFRPVGCPRYPWSSVPDDECEKVSVPPALDQFLNQWIRNVIFELQVTKENGTQYLTLGGGNNPFVNLPFDLGYIPFTETRIALNFDGLPDDGDATISEPFTIRVASTSYAAWFIPRWFSAADIALITWWHDSRDSVEVPLRVLRDPSKGILEVWPEHWDWAHFPNDKTPPSTVEPLIAIKIPNTGNRAHFSDSLPGYPISSSPTPYTLPTRLILLLFIIPVGVLWYGLVIIIGAPFAILSGSVGGSVVSTIIIVLVNMIVFILFIALVCSIIWWFRNGRPPFSEVVRRSGIHGQWGQPVTTVGETVTYTYGLSIRLNRTPTASPSVELERDLEAGVETEAQMLSASKGKQSASQEV